MEREPISRTYRFAMAACAPWAAWWGRMEVEGLEALPHSGPVLLAGNHDSEMDPVAIGVAARGHRQIRALAKASLWDVPGSARSSTAWARSRSFEAPETRMRSPGRSKRCAKAYASACFPKARLRGRTMRARTGVSRLAEAVPETKIVCVAASGTIGYAKFPKRPCVRVPILRPGRRWLPGR